MGEDEEKRHDDGQDTLAFPGQSDKAAGGTASDSILARKLKKILEADLDCDGEMAEALTELGTFFTENTLKSRRFLRSQIEQRNLQVNRDFVEDLRQVGDCVDQVHAQITDMAGNVAAMRAQLEVTKSKTRDLIARTNQLRSESESVAKQERDVADFIAKYQLTEDEIKVVVNLKDRKLHVTSEFFEILERVQKIHSDCRVLVQSSGRHATALDIMEQMAAIQENALEGLYRWTQAQCRSVETSENPALLILAMKHLQERPTMLKYIIDEYCAIKRSALVQAFLEAVTQGGPHGTPKPIELHAHDPPRYVGDMLAWLHQTIPSETESIRSLLRSCNKVNVDEICDAALSAITEDVCRPLRSRVEQILLLESDPIVLHKLTNLIRFYLTTIKHVMPESSAIVQNLTELDQLACKQFITVLQATVQQQASATNRTDPNVTALRHDLSPTPSTMALLSLLREILSGASIIDEQQDQVQEIISVIMDPMIAAVQSFADSFPTTDRDVFMLNSLYQIHTTLALFQFNEARISTVSEDMQLHLDTLASEQTSSLIANLGLQPICTMIAEQQGASDKTPLSRVAGMGEDSLKEFLTKFDNFLVAPDVFLLPQTRLLVSSSHRKHITRRSYEVIAASYGQIHSAVNEPSNEYERPLALMPKTPEQVRLLLHL